jgi:hypothetical protein
MHSCSQAEENGGAGPDTAAIEKDRTNHQTSCWAWVTVTAVSICIQELLHRLDAAYNETTLRKTLIR